MLKWLSHMLFDGDEEHLRDLYHERDLLIVTREQISRDIIAINSEIRHEENKVKKC